MTVGRPSHPVAIHQAVDSLAPASAVSHCLLATRDILREVGYCSGIYARSRESGIGREHWIVQQGKPTVWLYHFSVSSPLSTWIGERARRDKVVLWYHNLTPPLYFRASDPLLAARLAAGREEVRRLARVCAGAIADSEFNAQDLREWGYRDVQIVPPVFLNERYRVPPASSIMTAYGDGRPNWLFVGRIAPNKRQDAVITAFHAYKRLTPAARLFLVGEGDATGVYRRWLENQIAFLGLQEDVHLAGQVSQAELNAYYQAASCFVSLSEHEGFGVPLVESMYFDVPLIAYGATAVAETLGGAGILIREQNPFLVAELAYLLDQDSDLRSAVLATQRRRLADFSYEIVSTCLLAAVERLVG